MENSTQSEEARAEMAERKSETERSEKCICLAFEVHQPFRLRKEFFWCKEMFKRRCGASGSRQSEDIFHLYFSDDENRRIFEKVARKCYRPTNEIILRLLESDDDFKVAYSISGIFVEQCERYGARDILEDFRQMAHTGKVEFLEQTYFHSLVSLYEEEDEFVEQVRMHRDLMRDLIGVEPTFFENTELLYNNRIARIVERMGYEGIFAEGTDKALHGRSPNYVYEAIGCKKLRVLLRNYMLTDDIGFRFSQKSWSEYPLTAEKYAMWLDATPGQCINIFLDYETFGEHHWEDTGIFEFLEELPSCIHEREMQFATPTEIIRRFKPIGVIDVRNLETTSWADIEKDTSCFIGNTMQWACYDYLKWLHPAVKESGDENMLRIWRLLSTSDHLYYMFTAGGSPGEVHSYFSHFNSPYDAFVTMFSVIHDFHIRLHQKIKMADHPFMFHDGTKVLSLKGLQRKIEQIEHVLEHASSEDTSKVSPASSLAASSASSSAAEELAAEIEMHILNGDFERWVRESVCDSNIAEKIAELRRDATSEQNKIQRSTLLKRMLEILKSA